jgi:hypothetical protein
VTTSELFCAPLSNDFCPVLLYAIWSINYEMPLATMPLVVKLMEVSELVGSNSIGIWLKQNIEESSWQ